MPQRESKKRKPMDTDSVGDTKIQHLMPPTNSDVVGKGDGACSNANNADSSTSTPSGDQNTASTFQCDLSYCDERTARIIYDAIRIDEEPKRSNVQRKTSLRGNVVQISLSCNNVKNLRRSLNNLLDMAQLSFDTVLRFDNFAQKQSGAIKGSK